MYKKYLVILAVIILFCLNNEVNAKEVTCVYSGSLSFTVTMKSESDINFSNKLANDFIDSFKNTFKNNTDCPVLYYGVVPSPDPLSSPTYTLKDNSSSGGSKLSVTKNVIDDIKNPVSNGNEASNTETKSVMAVCQYGTSSSNLNVEYTINYNFSNNTYELNTSYKKIGHLIQPKMSDEKTFVNSFKNGNNLKCLDKIYAYNSQGTFTIYATAQNLGSEFIFDKSSEVVKESPKDEVSCKSKFGYYYVTKDNKRFVSDLILNGASSKIIDNTTMKDFQDSSGKIVCPAQFYYVQNHGPSSTEYMVYGPVSKPKSISFDNQGFSTKMYSQEEVDELIKIDNSGNENPTGNYEIGCGIISADLSDKLSWFLDIIKYGGVILAIGLGMLDFAKAVFSDENDANKKASQKFIKRIISAVLIFLVPLILQIVLDIVEIDGVDKNSPFCIGIDS